MREDAGSRGTGFCADSCTTLRPCHGLLEVLVGHLEVIVPGNRHRSTDPGSGDVNGLLRQFFPKGTDFARISHRQVARTEELLNERPRKRLGYRTPQEVLANRMRCN